MTDPVRQSKPASTLRQNLGGWAALVLCVAAIATAWWLHIAYPQEPPPPHVKNNFERSQDLRLLSVLMVPFHVLSAGRTLPAAAEVERCRAELLKAGMNGPTPECAQTSTSAPAATSAPTR